MSNRINFQCIKECSSTCCRGATIITLSEIDKLYKFFPITIGFRKVFPFNSEHEKYLQEITFNYKNFYIIGDFIAGNRFSKKCRLLKNSICTLHGTVKPLQCHVIPFSVTFPEEYQDKVIKEKLKSSFRNCKGFNEEFPPIWNGNFIDLELKNNFYRLKEAIHSQVGLMEKIFATLLKNPFFPKFIFSKEGFLEIPIMIQFIEEICHKALVNSMQNFIEIQKYLLIKELTVEGSKNSLFIEALDEIDKIKI